MQIFEIDSILAKSTASHKSYFEFLRVPSMSLGIYRLPAGSQDHQKPHKQDEVYYVQTGRAAIEVDGTTQPVVTGSIIYVPALANHRFKQITEDLELLVFFAPAEED
ncbi:MAG: cupin domain-containing protein [Anaerolineales bacterium]